MRYNNRVRPVEKRCLAYLKNREKPKQKPKGEIDAMKFLHLADLHLGKRLNDVSFLEDQVRLLCQVEEIARSEQADAVLIAGDVYQKASPQSEAMAVFDQFITRL